MDANKLKLYIVIKDTIPLGKAIVSVAHASLMAHLTWYYDDEIQTIPENYYGEWLQHSFKKVVCICNDEQFNKIKEQGYIKVITESTLDGIETGIVINPCYILDKELTALLKELKLYQHEGSQY